MHLAMVGEKQLGKISLIGNVNRQAVTNSGKTINYPETTKLELLDTDAQNQSEPIIPTCHLHLPRYSTSIPT